MRQHRDLTGQRFGRLVVIERAPRPPYYEGTYAWWRCRCDCGNETVVRGRRLTNGETKSCGCYKRDVLIALNKTRRKDKT